MSQFECEDGRKASPLVCAHPDFRPLRPPLLCSLLHLDIIAGSVTSEERDIGIRQTGFSLQLQIDLHPDTEKLTYPWRVNP